LDLAIAVLAALLLGLITTRLRFDDPRWQYNGWTYVIAIPLAALVLAFASRAVVSRLVHRSLQLGFLFSVLVHLLLLIVAVNVVIFQTYFPAVLSGTKQERSPIRRTIPEYIFKSPSQTSPTPDWSQPVDAATSSRVIPSEERQIPPVDLTAAKLEIPRPRDFQQPALQKFLLKRETPVSSLPQPAESPGRLARPRTNLSTDANAWSADAPRAPQLTPSRAIDPRLTEQPVEAAAPTRSAISSAPARPDVSPPLIDDNFAVTRIQMDRHSETVQAGSPEVRLAESQRRPANRARQPESRFFEPAGARPQSIDTAATSRSETGAEEQPIGDRLAELPPRRPERNSGVRPTQPPRAETSRAELNLDILLDDGPAGMASQFDPRTGIVPGESIPEIASLELSPSLRRRRDLGGPVTPFGTKIAAVESFSRRVKRTAGGAAPTPAGAVGPATEKAIERGLEYLASVQNDDGSWSLQGHGSDVLLHSDTAATGLCLLAFQGAGYTHRQHQHADTVSRGLQFLLAQQKTNGDLYRSENQISNENVALYSHGIASLALCEAYGMTQDAALQEPAQAAIQYIVATQHRVRGGWRYVPGVSSDTSVTGWMMMALKSGQLAGLQVPRQTYAGIQQWLDYAQVGGEQQDRYRYNPFAPDTPSQRHGRLPTPTMTAVGMLMRMYLGWQRENPAMQSAADYLLEYPPQMGTRQSPQRDGYYWYYATMVMFHMGGNHWQRWNDYLKPVLLESQIRDGAAAGSWDPIRPVPDRWSPHAGRLYVTTMNLLNLEVYYRHLPIYDDGND
jgi:hypothetical protein